MYTRRDTETVWHAHMRRRIHAYMEDTCIYIHVSIQRLYDTCRERERENILGH